MELKSSEFSGVAPTLMSSSGLLLCQALPENDPSLRVSSEPRQAVFAAFMLTERPGHSAERSISRLPTHWHRKAPRKAHRLTLTLPPPVLTALFPRRFPATGLSSQGVVRNK